MSCWALHVLQTNRWFFCCFLFSLDGFSIDDSFWSLTHTQKCPEHTKLLAKWSFLDVFLSSICCPLLCSVKDPQSHQPKQLQIITFTDHRIFEKKLSVSFPSNTFLGSSWIVIKSSLKKKYKFCAADFSFQSCISRKSK